MALDFSKEEIDIPCPGCGYKTKKKIGWLKQNHAFDCPQCHNTIRIDAQELFKGFDDLNRKLGRFFR